jgi:hypothetical protein
LTFRACDSKLFQRDGRYPTNVTNARLTFCKPGVIADAASPHKDLAPDCRVSVPDATRRSGNVGMGNQRSNEGYHGELGEFAGIGPRVLQRAIHRL